MASRLSTRARRRGFTLIEMIVAIAILVVLVGAAVPVTSKVLSYKARKATREELEILSQASADFFRDTRRLPADLSELLVDPGDAGWSGPYLPGVVTDQITGLTGYQVDAWSRAYQLSANGDVLEIKSAGEDAQFGTSEDMKIDLNVTWIRREETLDQLKTINQAITLYNGMYQASDPLPANWTNALAKLVSKGLLPSTQGYATDAWGTPFLEEPQGKTPVVQVQSTNVSAAAGAGGAGVGSGKGKKPKVHQKR